MHFNVPSSSPKLNQQLAELMVLSMHYCSSFCLVHRPTQGISLKLSSNQTCPICFCKIEWNSRTSFADIPLVTPCCKMTWFHNSCLQVIRISFLKTIFSSLRLEFVVFLHSSILSIYTGLKASAIRSSRTSRFSCRASNFLFSLAQWGKGPSKLSFN